MSPKILMVVGDYVDDYELMVPYSTLTMFGCNVNIISLGRGKGDFIRTAVHYIAIEDWELILKGKPITYSESLGHPYRVEHEFNWEELEEEVKNYDGLILPGGRAPEYLALLPDVQKIVYHFIEKNKPIGAICHGPFILTHADVSLKQVDYLKGKRVYLFPSINLECKLLGAIVEEQYPPDIAYTDGNLVTAPSWQALPEFMKQFLKLLKISTLP